MTPARQEFGNHVCSTTEIPQGNLDVWCPETNKHAGVSTAPRRPMDLLTPKETNNCVRATSKREHEVRCNTTTPSHTSWRSDTRSTLRRLDFQWCVYSNTCRNHTSWLVEHNAMSVQNNYSIGMTTHAGKQVDSKMPEQASCNYQHWTHNWTWTQCATYYTTATQHEQTTQPDRLTGLPRKSNHNGSCFNGGQITPSRKGPKPGLCNARQKGNVSSWMVWMWWIRSISNKNDVRWTLVGISPTHMQTEHVAASMLWFANTESNVERYVYHVETWARDQTNTELVQVPMETFKWDGTKGLYTDGSCFSPTDPWISSAGSSAIQMDLNNAPFKSATMTVGSDLPTTASAGEHMAIWLVDKFADKALKYITDYTSVLFMAANNAMYSHTQKLRRNLESTHMGTQRY